MVEGTLIGAYRLVAQIGEGGMGAVWLAEHTMLGRRAAIKLLHPSCTTRPEIVTRFFNEARAATTIADPGIVQIFDFGHHTDGSAYIVMELLEGETLHDRIRRDGALAVADALRILRQVAGSLGAAHARGIVHRDLKPENLYLVRDPEVPGGERAKILDFGIAKLVSDPTTMKTNASLVLGTPTFMSPEQCRGAGQVDQRSDIYSLGCVLFAVLTARPPFVAAGAGELIAMHLMSEPPIPSELVPGIPADVDELVARCLAKDPANRFASGDELARRIGVLLGQPAWPTPLGVPVHRAAPPAPIAAMPSIAEDDVAAIALAPSPTTLSAAARVTDGSMAAQPRRRTWLVGIAAVIAIGSGATVFALARGSSDATPPESAPIPIVTPVLAPTPTPPAPAPIRPPDPSAALAARMTDVLARFTAWAPHHAGQPCPDLAALGGSGDDPWGHPIRITCTDQPGDQIIGAVSAGADGKLGTDDDIASWQLGRAVTSGVRGARWVATPHAAVAQVRPPRPPIASQQAVQHPPPRPPPPPAPPKPALLDATGMPVNR